MLNWLLMLNNWRAHCQYWHGILILIRFFLISKPVWVSIDNFTIDVLISETRAWHNWTQNCRSTYRQPPLNVSNSWQLTRRPWLAQVSAAITWRESQMCPWTQGRVFFLKILFCARKLNFTHFWVETWIKTKNVKYWGKKFWSLHFYCKPVSRQQSARVYVIKGHKHENKLGRS